MVWLSFVIMTVILFTPILGLSRFIQGQVIDISIPLPVLGLFTLPLTGIPLLALCSIVLWFVVWSILQLLEAGGAISLEKMNLRNRFLYATRPYFSNRVVFWLSNLILAVAGAQFILPIVANLVGLYLGQDAMQIVINLLNILLGLKFDIGVVVLCVLVVVASSRFRTEQISRYATERHQRRLERKKKQTDIIVPPIERHRPTA